MIPKKVAACGMWLCAGFVLAMGFAAFRTEDLMQTREFLLAVTMAIFGGLLLFGKWASVKDEGALYGHNRLVYLKSIAWPQYHFYGGSKKWYHEFFKVNKGDDESIALVACRHKNGNIYAVERPGRHAHIFHMLHEMGVPGHTAILETGFVTNHGRFVNRQEGVVIASTAGQLIRKTQPTNKLFSEDLWTTPIEYRSAAVDQQLLDYNNPRASLLTALPSMDKLDVVRDLEQMEGQELVDALLTVMVPVKQPPRVEAES